MTILYSIIFFIFGTFFGSFFTVVGIRLPKKENFLIAHSHCDKCHHELHLIDMIPIFSYIILKKQCRYCHQKISPLSTYMELFTGILFALAFLVFGFSAKLLIALGIIAMLIIISVSDITYLIIPDELLIFFACYFFIIQIFNIGLRNTIIHCLSGIFLFLLMYFILYIGTKIFKKECLGGGDIKMMFIFGLILDPLLGTISIFLGSFIALPLSLFLLLKKNEKMIPFGPFLLIALTFLYFTGLTADSILKFLTI